jgi:molybdopterin-guanine dinucleotide biosynthesis protein A
MDASGIVLCGGRSSRMGRPKALLPWRGRTLLESVVDVLREVTDRVVVVSSGAFELPRLADVEIAEDREPGLGPLGGIREGLHRIGTELAFVATTDAPFLSPRFVRAMLARGRSAACELDGHVQTLCAVYEREARGRADVLIETGRMRPLFLLEESDFERVPAASVPDAGSLYGFNTPAQYLTALRDDGASATATLELFGRARWKARAERIEVEVGTLGQVLERTLPALCPDGVPSKHHLYSLNGEAFVRDAQVPIGPAERLIVMDAAVGG